MQHGMISLASRHIGCRHAVGILQETISTVLQQERRHSFAAFERGQYQARVSVKIGLVNVGAVAQQVGCELDVAVKAGEMKCANALAVRSLHVGVLAFYQ